MRSPRESASASGRDPKAAELKQKVSTLAPQMIELLFDKAVRHIEDPAHYPLPPGDTPERKLVERLRKVKESRRSKIFRKIRDTCRPQNRETHFGALAGVDLASAAPLGDQMRERLQGHLPVLDQTKPSETGKTARAAAPRGTLPREFRLRVNSVEQVKKTIGIFEGKDEIRLQVSVFNQENIVEGSTPSVREIELGKFKRHATAEVNQVLGTSDFLADRGFPQTFVILLELFEVDRARPDSDEATEFGAYVAASVMLVLYVLAFFTGPGMLGIMAVSVLQLPFTTLLAKWAYEDDAFQPFLLTSTFNAPGESFDPFVCNIKPGLAVHGQYKVTVEGELI